MPLKIKHSFTSPFVDTADASKLKPSDWNADHVLTGSLSYDELTGVPAAYTHPTGDGNFHVPATGTANSGKVLTAGATAGSLTWETGAGGVGITVDATITVATSGGDFTSVQAALDSLISITIAQNVTVTILIADGTFTSSSVITIPAGEQFSRVIISGTNTYTKTISSIASRTGTVGDYSLILNMADVTDIAVNDYILIPVILTGGTYPKALTGCFKITAIAANTITIYCKFRQASYLPSGAVTGDATIIKTILNAAGCGGIALSAANKLKCIKNLVLSGDATAAKIGLSIPNSVITDDLILVGISYFENPVSIFNGSAFSSDSLLISNATGNGVLVIASVFNSTSKTVASCCAGMGILFVSCNSTCAGSGVQNGSAGLFVSPGSVSASGFYSYNYHGLYADSLAIVLVSGAAANNNAYYGYYSARGSLIISTGSTGTGNAMANYFPTPGAGPTSYII